MWRGGNSPSQNPLQTIHFDGSVLPLPPAGTWLRAVFLTTERRLPMATTKAKRAKSERRPEKKWGPFAGGTGVAVWLNEFQTASGTRYARTITLAPRRFRDPKTTEWRDGAYRPVDLPALLLAIQ